MIEAAERSFLEEPTPLESRGRILELPGVVNRNLVFPVISTTTC
jgi:hypothetical protein